MSPVIFVIATWFLLFPRAESLTTSKVFSDKTSLPTHTCHNLISSGVDDPDAKTILPNWIQFSRNSLDNLGIIQTPNFPEHFPLPLRCVWIFNNTEKFDSDRTTRLFIYFHRVSKIIRKACNLVSYNIFLLVII